MDLKELLFFRAKAEVEAYKDITSDNGYTEAERAMQKQRFDSIYQVIEEAGLEDEYEAWRNGETIYSNDKPKEILADNPSAITISRDIDGVTYNIELTVAEAEHVWHEVELEHIRDDVQYRIEELAEENNELVNSASFDDDSIAQIAEKVFDSDVSESYWLEMDGFIEDEAKLRAEDEDDEDYEPEM